MKLVFALLVVALATTNAALKNGLRVRFNLSLFGMYSKFFIEIPHSVTEATEQQWTLQRRPADQHLPSLVLYCPQPEELCAFYDDTGYIAGLQIGLPTNNFTGLYNMNEQGWTEWTAASGLTFWTIQEYFVNEEFLKTDSATRIANRQPKKLLQQDYIWISGINREIFAVPVDEKKVTEGGWTKQACIPWMGQHYYWEMSKNTVCSSTTMMPWFPLYTDGQLNGMGMVTMGKLPVESKDWFERPPTLAVKAIVPRGPQCLYDISDNTGLVTSHTYFVDRPNFITCPLF